mgnify:CR=1 FL=1
MPPGIVDVDRDGRRTTSCSSSPTRTRAGARSSRASGGDAADTFGPTVFYVIIEDDNTVSEWAGTPRLDAPARAKP